MSRTSEGKSEDFVPLLERFNDHTIEKAVFSGFLIRCRPRLQIINMDFIQKGRGGTSYPGSEAYCTSPYL